MKRLAALVSRRLSARQDAVPACYWHPMGASWRASLASKAAYGSVIGTHAPVTEMITWITKAQNGKLTPGSVGGDLEKHLNTFTRKGNGYIKSTGRTISH